MPRQDTDTLRMLAVRRWVLPFVVLLGLTTPIHAQSYGPLPAQPYQQDLGSNGRLPTAYGASRPTQQRPIAGDDQGQLGLNPLRQAAPSQPLPRQSNPWTGDQSQPPSRAHIQTDDRQAFSPQFGDLPGAAASSERDTPIRPSFAGAVSASASDSDVASDEVAIKEATLAGQIAAAQESIGSDESIDAEKKEEELGILRKAAKWLADVEQFDAAAAKYRAETEEAPDMLAKAKSTLNEMLPEPTLSIGEATTLTKLEAILNDAEEKLKSAQSELEQAEQAADSTQRAERKAEVANQLSAAESKIAEIAEDLKRLSSKESVGDTRARRLELQARQRARKSQGNMLEAERSRLEGLAELFPLQRDIAQRHMSWQEKYVERCREAVANFRKAESERQAAEARQAVSQAHPALRKLAERNAELTERRTKLTTKMESVASMLKSTADTLTDLKDDFGTVKKKVDVSAMTPTIGMLMRARRNRLPDLAEHKRRTTFAENEMQDVQTAQMELEVERSELGDLDETIEQAIIALGRENLQFEPAYLQRMVRGLMQDRREYISKLLMDYETYHEDLNQLDLDSRKLISEVEAYRQFIDENVLWIRSTPPLAWTDVTESGRAVGSIFRLARWQEAIGSTRSNFGEHPIASSLFLIACLALFTFRRRIVTALERNGGNAASHDSVTIMPAINALLMTVALAAVWPLALWSVGWWMSLNDHAPDLAIGLARGLRTSASVLFALELFRQVCRPKGLAEVHFRWQIGWLHALHRSLNRLTAIGLPLVFLVSLIDAHAQVASADSLGRVAMLMGLGVLTLFMHDMLQPWSGKLQVAIARMPCEWPARLRFVWYVMGIGFPLSLAVLVAFGYRYSAEQLMVRFHLMLCLTFGLVVGRALLLRAVKVAWLRLSQFQESMEVQRRAMLRRAKDQPGDATDTEEHEPIKNVDLQLEQLVRGVTVLALCAGSWLIWSDMVPAFQVLDRFELWSTMQTVVEETTALDGSIEMAEHDKLVPVTLVDLACVIFTVISTVFLARTVPGLLQISILRRLPMDNGARHAVVLITRYTVTMAGAIVTCRMLGMTWASVQWLAAAMTVGLGFGLQEIFANLVSGLIILFERPIRIGDLVTVGGVTGKVTRMQIRATTITDFDRRELLVPNKRFITDDVVNWTLSDAISRFVIPIGISYESDPSVARRLLLEVAEAQPLVLKEPAPAAVFLAFGDSTLNLELRAFIGTRDHYVEVLHETNVAIEKAFREAGLEIAFPQQDIYIRSLPGMTLDAAGNSKSDSNATSNATAEAAKAA